jgi:hypothetical protein
MVEVVVDVGDAVGVLVPHPPRRPPRCSSSPYTDTAGPKLAWQTTISAWSSLSTSAMTG